MRGRFSDCASAFCRRTAFRRSEEHTSELQSPCNLVCRLLLEKKTHPIAAMLCAAGIVVDSVRARDVGCGVDAAVAFLETTHIAALSSLRAAAAEPRALSVRAR